MEVNAFTFEVLNAFQFGLVLSSKDHIICEFHDKTNFLFIYPETNLVVTKKVLGRNEEYNMPVVDSVIDKTFKVESNGQLKDLLRSLCK